MAVTKKQFKQIQKDAKANLLAISSADDIQHSGEGKKFYLPNMKTMRPIACDVVLTKESKDKEQTLYLITQAIKGAERTTRVSLGDYWDTVQSYAEGDVVYINIVDRTINPELTVEDVNSFAEYLKTQAEDNNETFVDNFASVRADIAAYAAGTGKRSLVMQTEITVDE